MDKIKNQHTANKTLIGSRLRQVRNDHRMTQKEFAKLLNISVKKYAAIENGSIEFPDFLCRFVAIKFHLRRKWIITGEGPAYLEKQCSYKATLSVNESKSLQKEYGEELEKIYKILKWMTNDIETRRKICFDDYMMYIDLKDFISKLKNYKYPDKNDTLFSESSTAFLLPLLTAEEMANLNILLMNQNSPLSEKILTETIMMYTSHEKERAANEE